jgi:tripartite ATP-independent transporter DctM subunit
MDQTLIALILLAALLLFLAAGLWIGFALLLVGAIGIGVFSSAPMGKLAVTSIWGDSADWTLTALPMFIWMGEILFRSRISEGMFAGLSPWLTWVPGRLLHVNVLGCALFSAVSGSSTATCATISRIALPQLRGRGYPESITLGSLAGAGTLGILIPPSVIMIVYAVAAEVSILKLFIAGILPGLLVTALFSGYIVVWSLANKSRIPFERSSLGFLDKVRATKHLLPCLVLIAGVIAGMFSGLATATEIGALGVAGALAIAALSGTLTRKMFVESAYSALAITCMIGLILAGSSVLAVSMALTGIPKALAAWVAGMNLHPYALIAALCVVYLLLGTALEGVAMILLTTSIVLPMVAAAGFDPIWFGIFLVIVIEMSAITPPVGFNLFVIQSMTAEPVGRIARASLPFFVIMVALVAFLTAYPGAVHLLARNVRA